jgi:hypothetical protein
LSFLQSSLTLISLDPGDYRWIDILRFTVLADTDVDDRKILRALIAEPGYAHSYATPRVNPNLAESPDLHGPYWRNRITDSNYKPIDSSQARAAITDWINDPASLRPPDVPGEPLPDVPGLAEVTAMSESIYTDDVVHLNPDIPLLLDRFLAASQNLYRLDDLRTTAEHEWGWVVGSLGYVEIASIAADRNQIALLVASDD